MSKTMRHHIRNQSAPRSSKPYKRKRYSLNEFEREYVTSNNSPTIEL